MKIINTFLIVLLLSIGACKSAKYTDLDDGVYADLQTDKGDILLKLEYEVTPITVANFVSLAEGTNPYVDEAYKEKPFYDGLKFHRIVADFMIQGGDPRGNGSGDPGYKFEDEINANDLGVVSAANKISTNGKHIAGWTAVDGYWGSFKLTLDQLWVCRKGKSKQVGYPGGVAGQLAQGATLGMCEDDLPVQYKANY